MVNYLRVINLGCIRAPMIAAVDDRFRRKRTIMHTASKVGLGSTKRKLELGPPQVRI